MPVQEARRTLLAAVTDTDPEPYVLMCASHRDPDIEQQMLAARDEDYLVATGRLAPPIHALNTAAARLAARYARSPDPPTPRRLSCRH